MHNNNVYLSREYLLVLGSRRLLSVNRVDVNIYVILSIEISATTVVVLTGVMLAVDMYVKWKKLLPEGSS